MAREGSLPASAGFAGECGASLSFCFTLLSFRRGLVGCVIHSIFNCVYEIWQDILWT